MRIGIADSGVNVRYSQVGSVAGGADFRLCDGRVEVGEDFEDLLGHGTAVAATIREHAPSAEIYALRIFRRRLSTHAEVLAAAVDWAIEKRLDLLNLSVRADGLPPAPGILLVAPEQSLLKGAIPVAGDPSLPPGEFRHREARVIIASTRARAIPGLPGERGFQGTSFAVARVTGLVADALSRRPELRHEPDLIDALIRFCLIPPDTRLGQMGIDPWHDAG